ncbi:GNAT family N-acetyltransferase [Microbacterium sp. NIBRBAC000506063]|nr:GNAT family N-acetyltransferase [Microbacterium sp. NIBRBAC000506063]
MAEVFNTAMEQDLGLDHLKWIPAEELPVWQETTYQHRRGYLARVNGRAAGALQVMIPQEEGATELEFDLLALPEFRGRGVEEALLEPLLDEARRNKRSDVQTYTLHRLDTPHDRMSPASGFGTVPVDEHTVFFRDHGFTLEQVERNSAFDLSAPMDAVQTLLDENLAVAGPDYRVVAWTAPTPERWREGSAFVRSRMSTDVPTGGVVWTEEHWDAERVVTRDRRNADAGLTVSVAAVEHVPSGQLVAYSELVLGQDRTRPSEQWGTLVVREHRGHRLGMIVKCANLLRWREVAPDSPFVTTFNAEENRPMLDVNERIGFTPLTVAGAWKRVLA